MSTRIARVVGTENGYDITVNEDRSGRTTYTVEGSNTDWGNYTRAADEAWSLPSRTAWLRDIQPPFSDDYSHLYCDSCGFNAPREEIQDPSHCPDCGYGQPDWVHPNFREAGSMEQDMGNMGESFDGGGASGGAGPGGYIYDVSDYETYAHTYNTVTDVPEGSDDSAPATTGSKKVAGEWWDAEVAQDRLQENRNQTSAIVCENCGWMATDSSVIEDWYFNDDDDCPVCGHATFPPQNRFARRKQRTGSKHTASDMGIGHRWEIKNPANEDGYTIWECEDCGESAATDADRPWDHPDDFMGDCQSRWSDGVYTASKRHTGAERDDGYGTYDGMNDALSGQSPLFTLTNLANVPEGTDDWDYINAYVIAYNQYA